MISCKLEEYLLCLKEQRFYDAHEAFEDVWFPLRFEDKNELRLIKGFINAAVSFELHKRGRVQQSKKVWFNYLKYRPLLYKIQTPHQNIYYQLSRHVETINHRKITENKLV